MAVLSTGVRVRRYHHTRHHYFFTIQISKGAGAAFATNSLSLKMDKWCASYRMCVDVDMCDLRAILFSSIQRFQYLFLPHDFHYRIVHCLPTPTPREDGCRAATHRTHLQFKKFSMCEQASFDQSSVCVCSYLHRRALTSAPLQSHQDEYALRHGEQSQHHPHPNVRASEALAQRMATRVFAMGMMGLK